MVVPKLLALVVPLVGLGLGVSLGRAIGSAAEDLAIAVLLGSGLYRLLRRDDDEEVAALPAASGRTALPLGISISLDELAVEFILGLLRLPAGLVVILIAVQTLAVAQGGDAPRRPGQRARVRARSRWRSRR